MRLSIGIPVICFAITVIIIRKRNKHIEEYVLEFPEADTKCECLEFDCFCARKKRAHVHIGANLYECPCSCHDTPSKNIN